jgi:hypothetical protein
LRAIKQAEQKQIEVVSPAEQGEPAYRVRRMFAPPNLKPTGPLEHKLQPAITGVKAAWISLPLGPIKAEALLVIPDTVTTPVPLVSAQHGIDSYPERVFGVGNDATGGVGEPHVNCPDRRGFPALAGSGDSGDRNREVDRRVHGIEQPVLRDDEFARRRERIGQALRAERT